MVMPLDRRVAKYTAKFDPAVIETRLIAIKEQALANAADAFTSIVTMELSAQTVLNEQGVMTVNRPKYYNFCREIWKLVENNVQDPTLTAMVVETLAPKYEALDCDPAILIALALGVFSITIPP